MPEFQRPTFRFAQRGMCLSRPVDAMEPGKYRLLQNVRTYTDGKIMPRPGLAYVATPRAGTNIHSIRRLNNGPVSWTRVLAEGTTLRYGVVPNNVYAGINLSGNRISLIPIQSPTTGTAWMSVWDTNGSWLVNDSGQVYKNGLMPPSDAPGIALIGDVGTGNLKGNYLYRMRYRNSRVGIYSNPGPPTRVGVSPDQQAVTVTVPVIADTDVDYVDIYRYGGAIKSWRYVGSTMPNSNFRDDLTDTQINSMQPIREYLYTPFPVIGPTRRSTGSVATVLGVSTVTRTAGDPFNVNWPYFTEIVIAGQSRHVYSVTDADHLTLVEDGGDLAPCDLEIFSPFILGAHLPYVWGPFGSVGPVIFACGDTNRPGYLYWTNPSDYSTSNITNSLEVSSDSEPLMNGCVYDGKAYIWSSERMFVAIPSLSTPGQFIVNVLPGSCGLFDHWSFAVGPKIWFVGRDGIYETTGGAPISITDEDLYPLFPHEGQYPEAVDGIKPMAVVNPDVNLSYYDGYLYFNYKDTDNNYRTLVYDTKLKAWMTDTYPSSVKRPLHYGEEGDAGRNVMLALGDELYTLGDGNSTDNGTNISCRIQSGAMDFGDPRNEKLFGDTVLDADTKGASITFKLLKDIGKTAIVNTALTAPTRQQTIIDINNGLGVLGKNLMLDISWATATTPELYSWQPALVPKPETIGKRATDWDDDGRKGAKFLIGCVIEADTENVARTIQVQIDGGTVAATLTVKHNGQTEAPYAIVPPVVCHEMRLAPTDAATCRLFGVRWLWIEYPEYAALNEDYHVDKWPSGKYIRGLVMEGDTKGNAVDFLITYDGGQAGPVLPSLTQTGKTLSTFGFATPFLANEVRLNPLGPWRRHSVRWIFDEYPDYGKIITPWSDHGSKRPKYVRGVRLRADTANIAQDIQIQADGGAVVATLNAVRCNGQQIVPYAVTPFIAYLTRLVPSDNWRFWEVEWDEEAYPDLIAEYTQWLNAGHNGPKFMQGVRLTADTDGVPVQFRIEYDGGQLGATTPLMAFNGKQTIPFSFAAPFIAHNLRIVPLGPARVFLDETEWVWEPVPDLALYWDTQETNHDLPGYHFLRDAYIAYQSAPGAVGNETLTIKTEYGDQTYNLPCSTTYKRLYIPLAPQKAKWRSYHVDSTLGVRLFVKDTVVRVKGWGQAGEFIDAHPFGDLSRTAGARI